MLNPIWRRYLRHLSSALAGGLTPRRGANDRRAYARLLANARLEELEARFAPASFAVDSHLQITRLSEPEALATETSLAHAVVFFESAVADYQILRQGLDAGTDAVVLDSGGDGLREMAAFLAGRHDLTAIGVVTHGAPGAVSLGSGALNVQSLGGYTRELAVVGSALGKGGELDLWSCDVAAGQVGASLVNDLAVATDAGVAASDHPIGAEYLGGNWQLDVRVAGARGEVPIAAAALGGFPELLGTWSLAASMATPRARQTATLLDNGKVLVTGGYINTPSATQSSAELYDPASNTWSETDFMATPRQQHVAILLSNGRVLVAGGFDNSGIELSSAELYDSASNTWSSAGTMAAARSRQPTATLLDNGTVLVTGGDGVGGALASTELYDPVSDTWSDAASMSTARYQHTATLLGNGKVLITGGTAVGGNLSGAELYDPVNNTWSSAGSLAIGRSLHTATLLSDGKVLVTGGTGVGGNLSGAELYDPVNNTWSSAGSLATGRSLHTATLLNNGKVLVTGGITNSLVVATSTAELYDPLSKTWSAVSSLATGRFTHTATLLMNGIVLVAGGRDVASTLGVSYSSAELYDPAGYNASQSTISVAPATIPIGSTATVTLTARDDSGNPLTSGGLPFSFGLGAGTGSGTFSNLSDNNNGTYAATFTGTTAGPIIITATLDGQTIASTLPTINVTPAVIATSTVLAATPSATTGGILVTFTATVAPSPGAAGTVTFKDAGADISGTVPFTGGVAQFQTSSLSVGSHPMTASYSGSPLYLASTSNPLDFVVNAAIGIAPETLPNGTVGAEYSQTITATNGTGAKTFAISAGALPAGLSLNPTTGVIAGTPTAAGTSNFTVTATDTVGAFASQAYAVAIVGPPPAIASVVVNGGPNVAVGLAGQSSVVKQILVTFNTPTTLDAGAFTVTPHAGVVVVSGMNPATATVTATATAIAGSNNTQYLVNFSGPGVHGGGDINDGVYDLTAIASKVHANSQTMASNRTDVFFALFGTVSPPNVYSSTLGDGNSEVFAGLSGYGQFVQAYGSDAETAPLTYNAAFDANLDGFVDNFDLGAFVQSFGVDWKF